MQIKKKNIFAFSIKWKIVYSNSNVRRENLFFEVRLPNEIKINQTSFTKCMRI